MYNGKMAICALNRYNKIKSQIENIFVFAPALVFNRQIMPV